MTVAAKTGGDFERAAVVTGSKRHIGLAIALRLAADGFRVALNHRTGDEEANAALARVRELAPGSICIKADVSTEDGAYRLIDGAAAEFGRLDLLVNNAGAFFIKGVAEMTLEEFRTLIDGNLTAAFLCSRRAIPVMRTQGGGLIINIGSAKAGTAQAAGAYGIAKTGVVMLARYIAKTEGKYGIRASAVNPGIVRTSAMNEEQSREAAKQIPLGKTGTPEDIAAAISFLASPDASYITGAVLDVGGGLWV